MSKYPSAEQVGEWLDEYVTQGGTAPMPGVRDMLVRKACDWAATHQRERDAQICEDMVQGPVSHSPHDEARQDCADAIRSQAQLSGNSGELQSGAGWDAQAYATMRDEVEYWKGKAAEADDDTMLKLSELMRGLEIPPASAANKPAFFFAVGRAIANQAKAAQSDAQSDAQEHDENSYRWRLGRRLSEYLDSISCDDRISLDPCDSRDIDSLLEEIFSVPADAAQSQVPEGALRIDLTLSDKHISKMLWVSEVRSSNMKLVAYCADEAWQELSAAKEEL